MQISLKAFPDIFMHQILSATKVVELSGAVEQRRNGSLSEGK